MTKYHASYNGQNGPTYTIEAETETGAKRQATTLGAYGHDIALIELDASGEQICCIATKEYGKKWRNQNI